MWPICYSNDGLQWWCPREDDIGGRLSLTKERIFAPLTTTIKYYIDSFRYTTIIILSVSFPPLSQFHSPQSPHSSVCSPSFSDDIDPRCEIISSGATSSGEQKSSLSSSNKSTWRGRPRGAGARGGKKRGRGRGRGRGTTNTNGRTKDLNYNLNKNVDPFNDNEILHGEEVMIAIRNRYSLSSSDNLLASSSSSSLLALTGSRAAIKSKSVPKSIRRTPMRSTNHTPSTTAPNISLASPLPASSSSVGGGGGEGKRSRHQLPQSDDEEETKTESKQQIPASSSSRHRVLCPPVNLFQNGVVTINELLTMNEGIQGRGTTRLLYC